MPRESTTYLCIGIYPQPYIMASIDPQSYIMASTLSPVSWPQGAQFNCLQMSHAPLSTNYNVGNVISY